MRRQSGVTTYQPSNGIAARQHPKIEPNGFHIVASPLEGRSGDPKIAPDSGIFLFVEVPICAGSRLKLIEPRQHRFAEKREVGDCLLVAQ